MPGPDVQQLPGGGGLTSYSFCTSPLYFAWAYLSYLMPSHFIVILSLSPCILFIVLGVPPPRQETRIIDYMSLFINYILYTFYTYIYIYICARGPRFPQSILVLIDPYVKNHCFTTAKCGFCTFFFFFL